ncbi:NAD(P)-dependent oxidoreductase [Cohnella sp. CBP 2801]|uniref:NAD(P)-dependent oxidoreductase n=2 Tax=Cohnella zeiphila TaxID=2761120 RepID=A0A7X0VV53_9BACL|nr:NAD(P)-dependent oxidoreductase [Cohnella zeiphila]MBB6730987.1 NAD(P)-dependent oxidoreductase [Cohnella zeiphila]
MSRIGFIGLGTMGLPMAANLLRKGYAVTVYNRTPAKADELASEGAAVAATPREAADRADVVITIVSNDSAVEEIYYGADGILNGLRPGTKLIDSSTISPALARRLAADASAAGGSFLDAPVTGSKDGAIQGTLLFMVGGAEETIEACRDIFLAMGREIIRMGESGSGATAKLGHNAIVGINAAGLIEGMAIAAKGGLDMESFVRVVQGGGAASKQADLKGPKIVAGDYSVQFALSLMLKDLRLASVLSDGMGVPTPMLEAAKSMFQAGDAKGYGDDDLAALSRVYEEWIGKRIGR